MTRVLTARSRGPGGPTTLSSLAHSDEISVVVPRSRLGLIVGASAVIVGGTIGSALALRGEPESAQPPAVAAPASQPRASSGAAASPAAPTTPAVPASPAPAPTPATAAPTPTATASLTPAPSAAAAPPTPEAHAALVAQIKDALRRFVVWSHAHPGARCPDAAALGAGLDPWGQPLRIVCSDQPPDQIAGVLSYGPDGEPGTRDDIVSWMLGTEVTELARGPHWSASRGTATSTGSRRAGAHAGGPRVAPPAPTPPAAAAAPLPRPLASAGAGSDDSDGDGIPDRR